MKNRLLALIVSLLAIWMIYDIFNSWILLGMFVGGFFIMVLAGKAFKKDSDILILFGLGLSIMAMLSTTAIWLIMIIIVIFKVSENQDMYNIIKEPLTKKDGQWRNREFVEVKFKESAHESAKLIRRKWFGNDNYGDDIYEWEDVNISKISGDTIIDLGNTILPKENNVVLIRKAFGKTKILIPDEVAVSLDITLLLGKVVVGEEEFALKNESLKWRSNRFQHSSRKIKLVSNVLFGEVEVIFL